MLKDPSTHIRLHKGFRLVQFTHWWFLRCAEWMCEDVIYCETVFEKSLTDNYVVALLGSIGE